MGAIGCARPTTPRLVPAEPARTLEHVDPNAATPAKPQISSEIAKGPSPPSTTGEPEAPGQVALAGQPNEQWPEAQWIQLALPDFEPALLWYRPNAPLWVITHGAGGNAEWHCQHFHRMLQGRASLLCPRGKRRFAGDPSQGYYYPDHLALQREVFLAVERYEAVARKARPYVYAGYSQGATMGALAVAASGNVFSDLLLVEGGFADWSTALVNQFKKSGGRAVLLVCGTQHCRELAHGAAARFAAAGVDAKVAWASGAGHRPDGPVEQRTLEALPFLLRRDERWHGFSVAPP